MAPLQHAVEHLHCFEHRSCCVGQDVALLLHPRKAPPIAVNRGCHLSSIAGTAATGAPASPVEGATVAIA
jgi:hypothetical protein